MSETAVAMKKSESKQPRGATTKVFKVASRAKIRISEKATAREIRSTLGLSKTSMADAHRAIEATFGKERATASSDL